MSNIIDFPKKNVKLQSVETLENVESQTVTGIASLKAYHINETLEAIVPSIFNRIEMAGFELEPEGQDINYTLKDGSLVVEALRSLLCKVHGIDHPMQKLAENVFKINEDNEILLSERVEVDLTFDIDSDMVEDETKPQ